MDEEAVRREIARAWRMAPDNFTPPSRTPWGGRVILERFKRDLELDAGRAAYPVVGESWEVSVEPSFPSRVVNLPNTPTLEQVIAEDARAALGDGVLARYGGCALLLKLLDAAEPLSVQVHPRDDFEGLAGGECGKPESWVIVAHRPGAGLYLGFREGVRRTDVETVLRAGGDLEPLLSFVPVAVGDCFELAPGTAHAIGAGVTLVEPQIVYPGRVGMTYRFWDWNRRYDVAGAPDPDGRPRALHLAESLAVTDFDGPRGEAFVTLLRRPPRVVEENDAVRRVRFIDGPLLHVEQWSGTGEILADAPSMLAGIVLSGQLSCATGSAVEHFNAGEAFAIAHALLPAAVRLEDAEVVVSAAVG